MSSRFRRLWARVVNIVSGTVNGDVIQGRDVYGDVYVFSTPPSAPAIPEVDAKVEKDYIDAFLKRNRCPPWNTTLCSDAQLNSVGVRFRPRSADDIKPPAITEELNKLDGLLDARHESLASVAERMLAGMGRNNVTVLLGDPGAGKSSFAVQLVHLVAREMASEREQASIRALPVYVNLAHFDDGYEPTEEGVVELVVDAVSQACPRHQMRTSNRESFRRFGEGLVVGNVSTPVLIVFDGMDEMPNCRYFERVRAIARFMDNPDRLKFTFLTTCRYADFVQLKDYTNNLHLQRWDLLPWSKRMAIDYLQSTKDSGDHLEIIKSIKADKREFYDPLEIALRAEVGRSGTRTALHEIWDRYLQTRLSAHLPVGLAIEDAIAELARIAFAQTWRQPSQSWEPDPQVIAAACRANLVQETPHGLEFAIRPLMHHLAGKELWSRVKASGSLPKQVLLKDINRREVLKCAGAQAGTDKRWTSAVYTALRTPGSMRTQGARLSVVSHALTPEQIASSEELRGQLVEVIAFHVSMADDAERKRCLEALKRQPALLDPTLPATQTLFDWIATSGSPGAVSWLLELFIREPAIRRKYRRILWRVVSRTLDEGQFSQQLRALLSRFLPESRPMRLALAGTRVALLGIGYYATYVLALTLATLVFVPLYDVVQPSGWDSSPSFVERWLAGVDFTNLRLQRTRLLYILFTIWVARGVLRARANEGLGPRRWWTRFPVLVLIVAGLRILLALVPLLRSMLSDVSINWTPLLWVAVFVGVAELVLILLRSWSGRRRGASRPVRLLQQNGSKKKKAVIRIGPTGVLEASTWFTRLIDESRRRPSDDTSRLLLGAAVTSCLAALGFLFGGPGLAVGIILFVLVGLLAYLVFLAPLRDARRTKRLIWEQTRNGLRTNFRGTALWVLEIIADESRPVWLRKIYVGMLSEVPFDDDVLYAALEACYAGLAPGPVRDLLTDIVLRAHHERLKDTGEWTQTSDEEDADPDEPDEDAAGS